MHDWNIGGIHILKVCTNILFYSGMSAFLNGVSVSPWNIQRFCNIVMNSLGVCLLCSSYFYLYLIVFSRHWCQGCLRNYVIEVWIVVAFFHRMYKYKTISLNANCYFGEFVVFAAFRMSIFSWIYFGRPDFFDYATMIAF